MVLETKEAQMSYQKSLTLFCCFAGVVFGILWMGYRLLQTPALGTISYTISDRVSEFIAEHEQDQAVITSESLEYDPAVDPVNQLQTVRTDCFAITLPRPIQYLKSSTERVASGTNDQSLKCTMSGLFSQPRAQLNMAVESRSHVATLEEHTGVQLRERESKQYQRVEITGLAAKQYRAYQSDTELLAIWLQGPALYTLSLYNMGIVDEDAHLLLAELLEALRKPELGRPN